MSGQSGWRDAATECYEEIAALDQIGSGQGDKDPDKKYRCEGRQRGPAAPYRTSTHALVHNHRSPCSLSFIRLRGDRPL